MTIGVGNVVIHQYDATTPYQGAGVISYTTGVTRITADARISTTGQFPPTASARGRQGTRQRRHLRHGLAGVETTGAYSIGVYVYGLGNATINSGTVYTKGYKADGIYAVSTAGGVNVTSGMVKTLGDFSIGIYAEAGGPVVVTSGTVVTLRQSMPPGVSRHQQRQDRQPIRSRSTPGNVVAAHGDFSDGIYRSKATTRPM